MSEAVVTAQEVPERLIAFVVPNTDSPPPTGDLAEFMRERLPDYMVPSHFVLLDAIPLTPNGKVDWQSLPVPDGERPGLEQEYVAPETPFEETLAEIWAELLRVDRVGVHDNFFDLGGHSLIAARVMSRVREAFDVDLPLRRFFESPTVAQLATVILQCWAEQTDSDELSKTLDELDGR